MKKIVASLGWACVPAFIILHSALCLRAQGQYGYTVTERGPDWKVLSKTVVENGTNRVHRYTELATGLNYTNAYGQLTEAKEQITIQPGGGAAATQGRHKVYFPTDIYNGVIEVVTPDGRHLKSRPLGVSYDDGSNTVFIAELKSAQGYLTSSNTVTYRDAFTGFKADLVCTYRRGGFECDLVLRQQPPTPGDYGLDESFSTLSMVTEFFDTQDPQQIPAASDEWFGLQDSTLKFGKLTMTHGKAFAMKPSGQTPATSNQKPVYKSWVNSGGRKFLVETVPVIDLAEELDALPLQAKAENGNLKPEKKTLLANSGFKSDVSGLRMFPPSHEVAACTNLIELAFNAFQHELGVVLDYTTIDGDGSADEITFSSGSTYLIKDAAWFGTVNLEGGAVIKFAHNNPGSPEIWAGNLSCQTTAANPAFFTMMDDNELGEIIEDSMGFPTNSGVNYLYLYGTPSVQHAWFYYADTALFGDDFCAVDDCQFFHCGLGVGNLWLSARNCLFYQCETACLAGGTGDPSLNTLLNCTADHCGTFFKFEIVGDMDLGMTNNLLTAVTNVVLQGYPNPWATFTPVTNHMAILSNSTGVYQSFGKLNHYLAASSPYRDAGTAAVDPDLLSEIQVTTTFSPADASILDTDTPDLGYHYAALSDPVAFPQSIEVCRNSADIIILSGSSPDNRPLVFEIVTNALHGLVWGVPPAVVYSPQAGFHGQDVFWFRAHDNLLDSANTTVTISVGKSPTATAMSVQTCSNVPANIVLDISDPCGEVLGVQIVSGPQFGVLSGSGTNWIYTPTNQGNASFDDFFTFVATNLFASSGLRNVDIHVDATPSALVQAVPANINKPFGVGQFNLDLDSPPCVSLKVFYTLTGTASNGVDFVATNLANGQRATNGLNFITIPAGQQSRQLQITALSTPGDPFDKTVIFTLVATNGYVINPNFSADTIAIHGDTAALFTTVTNLSQQPVGIDYSEPLQSLVVSVTPNGGFTNNFLRIFTNPVSGALFVTNWSKVNGIIHESKLTTVKQTKNQFTNGDVFFGTDAGGAVAWLSANGTRSNLNWSVLTTNGDPQTILRGGLYVDQTGTWSNNLIVVTGSDATTEGGDVWRINTTTGTNGIGTRVAGITNAMGNRVHLEGVITLTNDAAKWGPWAGRIITGAESEEPPVIYAIHTNGVVTNFTLGIRPEDFDIIPTNQDLYCCSGGSILKVSRTFFNGFVGRLLITEEGASVPPRPGKLHMVGWNPATTNFIINSISQPNLFEHVSFAPINLPSSSN